MSTEVNDDLAGKIENGAVSALRVANEGGRLEAIAERILGVAGTVFEVIEPVKTPLRGAFRDRHVS